MLDVVAVVLGEGDEDGLHIPHSPQEGHLHLHVRDLRREILKGILRKIASKAFVSLQFPSISSKIYSETFSTSVDSSRCLAHLRRLQPAQARIAHLEVRHEARLRHAEGRVHHQEAAVHHPQLPWIEERRLRGREHVQQEHVEGVVALGRSCAIGEVALGQQAI